MNVDNLKGQVIGQYELGERLGKGGMGVVYRAWQVNLEREVAFKVLSLEVSTDPELAKRFIREARTIAKLEHPHIVAVHDYGTHTFNDDSQLSYIVMRLLTGGSLADRLMQNKQLPFSEVVNLTQQLSNALAYAHSKNIIHRDIKPSNVMFDQHNTVLLVDFGIAKPQNAISQLTAAGQIVGTPEYMSPDQWGSEPISPAADQYSLAVVVYEMLSGHLPFSAPDVRILLRKVLYEPPTPIFNYRSDLPPAVWDVLNVALAKDPGERYSSITKFAQNLTAAFAYTLQEPPNGTQSDILIDASAASLPDIKPLPVPIQGGGVVENPLLTLQIPSTQPSQKTRPQGNARIKSIYIAIAAVVVVVVLGSSILPSLLGSATTPTGQAEVGQDVSPTPSTTNTVTDAPTNTTTPTPTFTPTATATPTPTLTNTPTATATQVQIPISSQTFAFVGFADGNPEIYVGEENSDLRRLTNNSADDYHPHWSPDGTQIAFDSNRDAITDPIANFDVFVMDADGSNVRRLTSSSLSSSNPSWSGSPSWSPDGIQIAFGSTRTGYNEIWIMNADGSDQRQLTHFYGAVGAVEAEWSPDGRYILFWDNNHSDLYTVDVNDATVTQLTDNPSEDFSGVWSPDGSQIAFCSSRSGNYDIYIMNADGSNQRPLTNNLADDGRYNLSWSYDGRYIAFISNRDDFFTIYIAAVDGSEERRLGGISDALSPAWKPI